MRQELVIHSRRPWRTAARFVVLLLVIGTTGWLVYQWSLHGSLDTVTQLTAERNELQSSVLQLRQRVEELRARVAVLERGSQIDRLAYKDVEQSLRKIQDERLDLVEELAFYRNILTHKEKVSGLRIHGLRLIPEAAQGEGLEFRYKLVLTRIGKSDKVTEGTIRLTVSGMENDEDTRLGLAALSGRSVDAVKFRLSNYQRLEGHITLPPGFKPRQVSVTVAASGKDGAKVERTFDWPSLVG